MDEGSSRRAPLDNAEYVPVEQMTLAGGSRMEPAEAAGALSERVLSYAAMAPID